MSLRRRRDGAELALRRSFVLRFADGLATSTLIFAMPLMIYNATGSLSWSGLAFMIEWLPRLVSIPFAGALTDHIGSRRVFIWADSARAVALGMAVVAISAWPHLWPVLLAVGVVNGILGQLSFVAAEHMGVRVPTKKSHHQVQSVQVNIDQTVMVLGPMLAGVLLALGNAGLLAGVCLLSVVSVARALRVRLSHASAGGTTKPSVVVGFMQGWKIIAANRSLQYVVAGTVAFNLLLALITVLTPAIVKGEFGGSDAHVSTLWAAGAAVSVVAVYGASRVMARTGIVAIGAVAGMLASLAVAVASFAHVLLLYAACVVAFLAMDGVYAVYIRTARARMVPSEYYGVTVGVIVLLSLIPFPLAGLVVATISPALIPVVLGGCTAICLAITFISYAKIDRRRIGDPLPAPAAPRVQSAE